MYEITISQIKYDYPEGSNYYYDILVMGDDDGEMVQIGHVGQGSHASPDLSQDGDMDAKQENNYPECYETAFLFTSVADADAFTSQYGTVQNFKIQTLVNRSTKIKQLKL